MENLAELLLEILFGLHKDTPEQMPTDTRYTPEFSLSYRAKGISLVLFVMLTAVSIIFAFRGDGLWFALLFAIPAIALLAIYIYQRSLRIDIDETCINERTFILFRKTIPWESVKCVRLIENDGEKHVTFALYAHDGRHLTDYVSDMRNFWLVVVMAERKGIEIRKEKNLSIKEIIHL